MELSALLPTAPASVGRGVGAGVGVAGRASPSCCRINGPRRLVDAHGGKRSIRSLQSTRASVINHRSGPEA